MKQFQARGPAVARDPGIIHVGFEFTGSAPGHLIFSFPDGTEDANGLFDTEGHYVELGDQLYGREDGVAHARIDDSRHFRLQFGFDAGIDTRDISVSLDEPMDEEVMALLSQLPGQQG